MSKITCEICGTSYPDTAGSCPICGWTNKGKSGEEDLDLDGIRKDFLEENNTAAQSAPAERADRKSKAIFDYDAVNTGKRAPARPAQEEVSTEEEEYVDEEEAPRTNIFLVVFLVVLIVALLLTTGYMFVRFFLPGRNAEPEETSAPPATAEVVETVPEITEEPTIPCSDLAIPDGIEEMKEPGQKQMIHVVILPEDTTDSISFVSENEAIATVDEEGLVTAVAEGETNIIVTCGQQTIKCPVKVHFVPEETEPVETVTAQTGVPEETEATQAADDGKEATQAADDGKKDVVIKLKKSDIQLGRLGIYYDLELDCDLTPEEVEWSSDNSYVASVNNGRVTVMGRGVATITAKYGDHEATCIVRCKF